MRAQNKDPMKPWISGWAKEISDLGRPRFKYQTQDESLGKWYGRNVKGHKKDIEELWHTFNDDRSELVKGLLSKPRMLHAYLLGFHMFNFARTRKVLERVALRCGVTKDSKARPTDLIDLGCGTGAISSGVLSAMQEHPLLNLESVTLVEPSKAALDIAVNLIESQNLVETRVHKVRSDIESFRFRPVNPERFTLISLGYVWNEIQKNEKAKRKFLDHIQFLIQNKSNFGILLLEPGHQEASRECMEFRDFLVELGMTTTYPCPSGQVTCPMLERKKDWCYSQFPLNLPEWHQKMDLIIGTDHAMLSTSAYWFEFGEPSTAKVADKVAVGFPLDARGRRKILSCSNGSLADDAVHGTHLYRGESF